MTPRGGISDYGMGSAATGTERREIRRSALADVSTSKRVWARLFAGRYDQQIEQGVTVVPGTPLAAHYVRLVSRRESEDMAAALTLLLRDAGLMPGTGGRASRVPIRTDAVRQSADTVEDVLARLLGPLPARARGMARLRLLLGDGRGPLYCTGPGTFAAAMRGVLAAM
jgi:hypothetical protein